MKLTKIWIVRDPSPVSELGDILYETDVRDLASLVIGTGHAAWNHEHTTLYTEEGEAKKDAEARMKKQPKEASIPERVARRFRSP